MILFIICAVVGTVFLLISIFAGGHADMDHDFSHDHGHDSGDGHEIRIFSFRSLTVFAASFGAVGAVCLKLGVSMMFSVIWGIVAGIIFALFAAWLMSLVSKQQTSSTVSLSDMVGLNALVKTRIPKGGVGEVSVSVKGQTKFSTARCVDPEIEILENTAVLIKASDSGLLSVEKS
jgi:membrane protein implicated in regulation of membrane protease activity